MDKYIEKAIPIYILISHLHLDHIYGLHILNKFNFCSEVYIITHSQNLEGLKAILKSPYTLSPEKLKYKAYLLSIPDNKNQLPFTLEWSLLKHTVPTFGFRVEVDNKSIVYCPDTGYCKEAVKLAKFADILIAECAYLPEEYHPDWPHLNPELAAKIAKEAKAKKLFLTHFDASRYTTFEHRKQAETLARRVFKNTFSTYDDLIVSF